MPRAKICPTCGDGKDAKRSCGCKNTGGRSRLYEDDATRVAAFRLKQQREQLEAEMKRAGAYADQAWKHFTTVANSPIPIHSLAAADEFSRELAEAIRQVKVWTGRRDRAEVELRGTQDPTHLMLPAAREAARQKAVT